MSDVNLSSLSIDLSKIASEASLLDATAETTGTVKRVLTRKERATKGTPGKASDPAIIAAGNPEGNNAKPVGSVKPARKIDPNFTKMLISGADDGFGYMIETHGYMDPGDTTREEVGNAIGRLIARFYSPEDSAVTDCIIIFGYVGMWLWMGRPKKKKALTEGKKP